MFQFQTFVGFKKPGSNLFMFYVLYNSTVTLPFTCYPLLRLETRDIILLSSALMIELPLGLSFTNVRVVAFAETFAP